MGENDAALVNSILSGSSPRERASAPPSTTGPWQARRERQNYGDAWFVGYTPQLAVAVWVGYPDRLKPMETEFEGDPVAGGTLPALIWKTFAEKALDHLEEPPELPYPSYQSVVARQVVYRDNRILLDNGNCKALGRSSTGSGPSAEADCKPNEVDVPDVVGMRLAAARDQLYSMPLTADVVWRQARPGRRSGV